EDATGAVSIKGLGGQLLANAYMKAETKAKRRGTLSICGLGWMDETEADSIPGAAPALDQPEPAAQIPPARTLIDDDQLVGLKTRLLALEIRDPDGFQAIRDEWKRLKGPNL